jgi:MFS family permease
VIGGLWFFLFARGVLQLSVALLLVFIGQFGSWPTLGAFGSELFPTAHRALAGSWSNVARVAGQSTSFALGALLLNLIGELSVTSIVLGAGPFLALVVTWLAFPETKGRELEEITGEDVVPSLGPGVPLGPLPAGTSPFEAAEGPMGPGPDSALPPP